MTLVKDKICLCLDLGISRICWNNFLNIMYKSHTIPNYTGKVEVVASWLLHCNEYVRQFYSECYNRDVQVDNPEI